MAAASDSLRRARPLLGTFVEISVSGAGWAAMERAVAAAFGAIERVQRLMSFHDPASETSRLNREAAARPVVVDHWTFQVLATAADLHRRSDGLFDIGVPPPAAGGIELLGGNRVRFRHPGIRIDLGGIAKGFAVDRAIEALRCRGMRAGLVNAGGDLFGFGPEPVSVELRDPRDPCRILCRVEIENEALASSGGVFDPAVSSHAADCAITDPRAQRPVSRALGASVRAPSCMIADALTKVVIIEPQSAAALLRQDHASALVVSENGDINVTREWDGALAA